MRSSFVQCLFLTITRCFMVYDVNLSLTKGEPFGSSVMAAMHVYNQAFTYKNYGIGQAQALILFVVCAIVGVTQVYIGKRGRWQHNARKAKKLASRRGSSMPSCWSS